MISGSEEGEVIEKERLQEFDSEELSEETEGMGLVKKEEERKGQVKEQAEEEHSGKNLERDNALEQPDEERINQEKKGTVVIDCGMMNEIYGDGEGVADNIDETGGEKIRGIHVTVTKGDGEGVTELGENKTPEGQMNEEGDGVMGDQRGLQEKSEGHDDCVMPAAVESSDNSVDIIRKDVPVEDVNSKPREDPKENTNEKEEMTTYCKMEVINETEIQDQEDVEEQPVIKNYVTSSATKAQCKYGSPVDGDVAHEGTEMKVSENFRLTSHENQMSEETNKHVVERILETEDVTKVKIQSGNAETEGDCLVETEDVTKVKIQSGNAETEGDCLGETEDENNIDIIINAYEEADGGLLSEELSSSEPPYQKSVWMI